MKGKQIASLLLAVLCATAFLGGAATAQTTEAECVWTLEINDTESAEVNGYTFTCTLAVIALKPGGTDELGVYSGAAHISYQYQTAKGSVSGSAAGEGHDLYAAIEVVPYRSDAYDAAAGAPVLTELVAYDAMALGELLLSGSGEARQTAGGASWSTADTKTVAAPYRIALDGGQVRLELYTIAPGLYFTGMITGEPI